MKPMRLQEAGEPSDGRRSDVALGKAAPWGKVFNRWARANTPRWVRGSPSQVKRRGPAARGSGPRPEGVRGFESHPPHHRLILECLRLLSFSKDFANVHIVCGEACRALGRS